MVAASLAVLGGALTPLLDAGARRVVEQSGPTSSAVRLEARLLDDPGRQDATVRDVVAESLRGIPVELERSVAGVGTVGEQAVLLLADPGAVDAATLVDGAWPSGARETAIQDAAATSLRLSPGDEITVADRTLTVSGIWRASDPAAPRWFGDPTVASGAEGEVVGPFLSRRRSSPGRRSRPS